MGMCHPKITVVTVVKNDAAGLEKTLSSVVSQIYDDLEVIVIDGGSTDGTIAVIDTFSRRIARWVSEPDAGPYDAMNKGLAEAHGEWINFMNAGDVFYDHGMVTRVFNHDLGDAGIVYGDSLADYSGSLVHRKCRDINDLWKGMVFFHQSMFVRTALVKPSGYDLRYRIGSDYDLVYRLYLEGVTFLYLPFAIAICDALGLSNRHMVASAAEHERIVRKYRKLTLPERLYYIYLKTFLALVEMGYKIIPRKWVRRKPHPQPSLLKERAPGGEVMSIITPSLNQAPFIERTIRSVLDQQVDFNVEYLVIDGGSKDGTIAILEYYKDKIKWVSEKDKGQSDAVRKGLAMSSGEIIGWLNSDDMYMPGTLQKVYDYFNTHPGCLWLYGRCRIIDENDREIRRWITLYKNFLMRHFSYKRLLIENYISQPSVFIKRSLLEKEGFIDTGLNYTMDYDLWLRLGRAAAPGIIDDYLAYFRVHRQSKSGSGYKVQFREEYRTHKKHHQGKILLFLHGLNILKIISIYWIMNTLSVIWVALKTYISGRHE
jgi:glycosyltransferase involved in cell wall biosynthesis